MTRVFLTVVVPLLLPTVVYVLWLLAFGRARVSTAMAWQALPWLWLGVAGVLLAAAVLFVLVGHGGPRNGVYVPPHAEGGRIVPGHVQPRAPAQ